MDNITNYLADFIEMGGYGKYVFPSFAVAVIVIAVMFMAALRSLKNAKHTLKNLQNLKD